MRQFATFVVSSAENDKLFAALQSYRDINQIKNLMEMNIRKLLSGSMIAMVTLCALPAMASCGSNNTKSGKDDVSQAPATDNGKSRKAGGPQLGTPGGGPVIDKSADSVLQQMIKTVVPQFRRFTFSDDETGKTLNYNLYVPKRIEDGK